MLQLQNLIDREELTLDSKKLAEFNERDVLKTRIDELAEEFISNSISADDHENITLVYKLARKIKEFI